jgi:hypothetical protein
MEEGNGAGYARQLWQMYAWILLSKLVTIPIYSRVF